LTFNNITLVFSTKLHQTLEDNDNPNYIEDHGPFPGNDFGNLYLGHGSYFWDNHLELAHWWGRVHIKRDYVICEAELNVAEGWFFDLVGCRRDMIHLKQMIHRLKLNHLALGQIIEVLKGMDAEPGKKGLFPFKVIRAVDVSSTSYNQNYLPFAEQKSGKTSLTPIFLICIIGKSDLLLSYYRIIYPEHYVQKD
jgi:hypothetical protein